MKKPDKKLQKTGNCISKRIFIVETLKFNQTYIAGND